MKEYLACKGTEEGLFFVTIAAWGKIPTYDNVVRVLILKKKNDNTVKGGFFFIGWCNGKTVDLYMIHGDVAYALWSVVLRAFGIKWVLPKRVVDLNLTRHPSYGKKNCGLR